MERTYGKISINKGNYQGKLHCKKYILIWDAEPQVCIRLKALFPKLDKSAIDEFGFALTDENCHEILWMIDRYPMQADPATLRKLKAGSKSFLETQRQLESIFVEGYQTKVPVKLNEGKMARHYQLTGAEFMIKTEKGILADDMGLGKTLTQLLCTFHDGVLPLLVVCQSHMTIQWQEEIEKYTNLSSFIIRGYTTFDLPKVDVYIINYHCLSHWISILAKKVKAVGFDECQELRRTESEKYRSASNLCDVLKYSWGLSGTPIFNYGNEIFNILDCLKKGCLGTIAEFRRQWCGSEWSDKIIDKKALGSYLREKFLLLRRTAKEVGRELPEVNRITMPVEYEEKVVEEHHELTKQLALTYLTSSSFVEKGQAGMELNMRMRQVTGIAKAVHVAAIVRILLENGEPVVLSAWHRAVYDIYLEQLAEFKPVMFTGTESPKQKHEAKKAFMNGETNLFLISNWSGVGLDGLQFRCRYVVISELDWSPQRHNQIITRVNRDGQQEQVTVIFPVCDFGSDPPMIEMLGLKSDEARSIIDPSLGMEEVHSDEKRIKLLAESYLKRSGIAIPKQLHVHKDGELKEAS